MSPFYTVLVFSKAYENLDGGPGFEPDALPLPLQLHEHASTNHVVPIPPTLAVFPACQIAVPPQHAAVSRRGFDTPFYQVSINEQELNLRPC